MLENICKNSYTYENFDLIHSIKEIVGALKGTWWRHQMETFSALLAICAGNLPLTGEFPSQRQVVRSFDVFFDLHLTKLFSKQWDWRFEAPSCPLWRHCNGPWHTDPAHPSEEAVRQPNGTATHHLLTNHPYPYFIHSAHSDANVAIDRPQLTTIR